MRRRSLLAFAALGPASRVNAQGAGSRAIRLFVGFSPGGAVDGAARLLAPRLGALLGQQVVVENRTGAAGLIAAEAVARAAPDGQTLLLGESAMLVAHQLHPNIVDPLRGFTPVAALFRVPLVVVCANDFPARTPGELLSLLKANPGRHSYATPGVGTVQHLAFEIAKARSGTFVVHIPYRGAAQIVPDVASGHVPLAVVSAAAALPQLRAGRLRALARLDAAPLAGLETVAPLSDALPGFEAVPRLFLLAPRGTPEPAVARLAGAAQRALRAGSPDAIDLPGVVGAFESGAAFERSLAAEAAQWQRIARTQRLDGS